MPGAADSEFLQWLQRMRPQQQGPNAADPSWKREDGTQKGMGFLGPLKFKDGRTSTELSIGVNFDGKQREIPSLVPTLTREEIQHLLDGNGPTPAIVDKAVAHARQRMTVGKDVFAVPGEQIAQPAPIDLRTGLPATQPPPGSNVINPYAAGALPPMDYSGSSFGRTGTTNQGIYPTGRPQ